MYNKINYKTMKKIINTLKFAAIMLLAGMVSSCGKEENETEKQIEFAEFAINESNCGWKNLNYDSKVIIINNIQDLGNYLNCTESGLPEIDFSKNTLLLASGVNVGGIADVYATLLTKRAGKDEYVLDLIVYKNETDVNNTNWQIAVCTPKISDAANVLINKQEDTLTPCDLQTERRTDMDIQNVEAKIFKEHPDNARQISQYICEIDGMPTLCIIHATSSSFFEICNFPENAKEWMIPNEGLTVVVSGRVFAPSRDHGINPANTTFFDLELTSFKKK
jgi:hypothetical protein